MKRVVIVVLVVVSLLASVLALGYLGYKHFIVNQIMDNGGMENPYYAHGENRPSEDAKLVYCSLFRQGTTPEQNYSYTLEQVDGEVLLYASYLEENGMRTEIEGQKVSSDALDGLNALALSLDLAQTPAPTTENEPPLLDGDVKSCTLRWDDGTTATPDAGFDRIQEYFDTKILS